MDGCRENRYSCEETEVGRGLRAAKHAINAESPHKKAVGHSVVVRQLAVVLAPATTMAW